MFSRFVRYNNCIKCSRSGIYIYRKYILYYIDIHIHYIYYNYFNYRWSMCMEYHMDIVNVMDKQNAV